MSIKDFFGMKSNGVYSIEYLESLVGKKVDISSVVSHPVIGSGTDIGPCKNCCIDSVNGEEIRFTTEFGEQRKAYIYEIEKIRYFGNTIKIICVSVVTAVFVVLLIKRKNNN